MFGEEDVVHNRRYS